MEADHAADYAQNGLFTKGTGCNQAANYIAATDADANPVILGDSAAGDSNRAYTDYRFGLFRVGLEIEELETGSLTVAKAIAGDAPREATSGKAYTFTIIGPEEAKGQRYGEVAFDADGKAVVTITGAESVTITGLPVGLYRVAEERDGAAPEGCELEVTGEGSVIIANNGSGAVTATNRHTEIPSKPTTEPTAEPMAEPTAEPRQS